MMEKAQHCYLHVDLDAFFASVEQLDNPELRGKPVIVGGKPEDRRSVVSTASYEARAFGVHSAMPVFQAYRLCPQGIFVHGRMHRYSELSHQIMNIFRDYSPDVDQMSIDEAFIDLTGTEKLFGPPEETAHAIKARVKAETGLTVSVGLASTKYLAKIASGLSKPDGFYHIKAGSEESFMLNLPLNKVWGLGPKSLELIRSKGFNSTRDIFERDYETLEFLFGKNMAGFLYNVVRGIEKESFNREAKTHSISAENTFPYDLTDIYTIETELLELAHGVFFRLLKEESYSRTAMVKIRYDDFSTCTVQETVDRNIITLDSFFEIIKKLFEKRYEKGRGIRLLGVGFENVVTEEKPYQQDLFSLNNDEKKQAVEKAILTLSKKHPEIKVSKARTIKAIILAFLICFVPEKIQAQEEEAPVSLFDYDINDTNHVDFSASGLWKIDFSSGLDITFGNDTPTAFSPSLPVFKQETDISTLLTINNHWYFEAAFADEFTKNTFAFGYKSEDIIRHFRLANRGITMSEGYSAEHFGYSLRGGNTQAPGMLLQLVSPSEKVQADFLLRYDMSETKSEIYYGMNKVSDVMLNIEDYAYGLEFRFPKAAEETLFDIDSVFVETASGSYTDERGKTYRKLRSDEYTVVRSNGNITEPRLFISQEAGTGKNADGKIPSILLTFSFSQDAGSIISACGSWTDNSSFFGSIQNELGQNGKYNISEYVYDFQTLIDGKSALVIQNTEGFSPFLCPSLYSSGTKKQADYLVIAEKSEIPVVKYQAGSAEETYTNLYENFFKKEEKLVRVINKDVSGSVYPFSEDSPEIYLGMPQKTNLAIRARTYSPVTEIILPKTASAGTIQVYKNGTLLTGTVFNENTGVIELNTNVSETDQLLITWQEENSELSGGAVAAAAGVKINFLPELTIDFLLSTRLPVNQKDDFIEYGSQKNSFTAFSSGITWAKNGFTLKDKSAVSLLNDNTAEGLQLYCWQTLWDDYQREKETSPDSKIIPPEKTSSVSFKEMDFSPYKKIEIEVEVNSENETIYEGPLVLMLDRDTGTLLSGAPSVKLEISKLPLSVPVNTNHKITIYTDKSELLFDNIPVSSDYYTLQIFPENIPSRLTLQTEDTASTFVIKSIAYTEAQYYGTARNYISAEYKKDGNLISAGDFAVLKDVSFSAESDQGSGNFYNPTPFVSAKAAAGFTLTGIKLSADAAIQNTLNSLDFSEAGHSVKTDDSLFVFRLISAEDNYRYRPFFDEVSKQNLFSLNFASLHVPVKTTLKTTASDFLYNQKQNSELTAEYSQKISDVELNLNLSSKFSQTIQKEIVQTEKARKAAYDESWKDISKLEFSTGEEAAAARNGSYAASLGGIIAFQNTQLTIKPKLTYELSDKYNKTEYSALQNPVFNDKEFLQLQLPFSTDKKSFSFEISRTGGSFQNIKEGGTYISDSQTLFELQNQRLWFYSSIPFYELFDLNLKDTLPVDSGYASKYEGVFRRSLYNSKKDLIIPSVLSLALTREISTKSPAADFYQIKLVITNNSVNNFGSTSKDKYFTWFNQEELSTNLVTVLKIPAEEPENLKLNIQTFAQLLLFLTEKSVITEMFDFSIETFSNWNLRNTISYSRPSDTSLITSMVKSFGSQYLISRKDSFTAEAGMCEAVLKQNYTYNHTVGIDFLEYYNINAGIGGTLTLIENKANKISLTLSLGAKAEF